MPFLPSIQPEDKVPHVLAKFQNGTQIPLLDFHQALLREASDFSVQERELMAAFVSGVNSCRYCYGAHSAVAKLFGVEESLLTALLDDLEHAPVDPKLRPVFHYLRKLTLTPTTRHGRPHDSRRRLCEHGGGLPDQALTSRHTPIRQLTGSTRSS